jgi:hypothetical protein
LLLSQTYWQQQVQAFAHQQALAQHQALMYLQACAGAGSLPLQNLVNQMPTTATLERDLLKEDASKQESAFEKLVSLVAAGECKESNPCSASPSPQVTTPLKGDAEDSDCARTPPKGAAQKPAKIGGSGKVWANGSTTKKRQEPNEMDGGNENRPPQWKTQPQTMITPGAYSPDLPKPR